MRRTAVINQMRGMLLERGITIRKGPFTLRTLSPVSGRRGTRKAARRVARNFLPNCGWRCSTCTVQVRRRCARSACRFPRSARAGTASPSAVGYEVLIMRPTACYPRLPGCILKTTSTRYDGVLSFADRDAALQHDSRDLVDRRGAAPRPSRSRTRCSDWRSSWSSVLIGANVIVGAAEASARATGIDVIRTPSVFTYRSAYCARHQAYVMALFFAEHRAQKMRSSAGLDADQALRKVRGRAPATESREPLLANHDFRHVR